MGFFKKKSESFTSSSNTGKSCCKKCCACNLVDSFLYFEETNNIIVTSECGGETVINTVDLNITLGAQVLTVTYDPVTMEYTITTDEPAVYTVSAIPPNDINTDGILHVMPSGDDSTGTTYRLDLPYATPWAAVAAAQSGDTVFVYPGSYNSSSAADYLAKDGVTVHMMKNAVITYTGAANTVRPLYDQGVPITFKITGEGTLNLYQTQAGGTGVANVMAAASSYSIELDTIETYNRMRSSAGSSFKLKAKTIRTTAEFFAQRNTVATATDIQIETDLFTQASTTNVLTPIDVRKISSAGSFHFSAKDFRIGYIFANLGSFYLEEVHGYVNIKIDQYKENAVNVGARPLFYVANGIGRFDIDIKNINHTGNIFDFASAGAVTSYGKVKLHGVITPGAAGAGRLVFNTGSKVEIDFDLEVNDAYSAYPITMTGVKESVYVTGKVRHKIGALPAATSAFFRFENSGGATTMATLKNFTIQTEADQPVYGTGPAISNIKCMGVYSNKAVNAALFAATLDAAIIVDSSIIV